MGQTFNKVKSCRNKFIFKIVRDGSTFLIKSINRKVVSNFLEKCFVSNVFRKLTGNTRKLEKGDFRDYGSKGGAPKSSLNGFFSN